jgi:hypothetical protein
MSARPAVLISPLGSVYPTLPKDRRSTWSAPLPATACSALISSRVSSVYSALKPNSPIPPKPSPSQRPIISPLTLFRMNTYKSVSKQRTLTPFRMNTCEKPRGEGPIIVNQITVNRPHQTHSKAALTPLRALPVTHYSTPTTHFLPLETIAPMGASLSMYVQERPGGPGIRYSPCAAS